MAVTIFIVAIISLSVLFVFSKVRRSFAGWIRYWRALQASGSSVEPPFPPHLMEFKRKRDEVREIMVMVMAGRKKLTEAECIQLAADIREINLTVPHSLRIPEQVLSNPPLVEDWLLAQRGTTWKREHVPECVNGFETKR